MKGSESRNKGGAKLFSLSGVFVEVDESSWGVGGGVWSADEGDVSGEEANVFVV